MNVRFCLGLAAVFSISLPAADPHWIRMRTANFEMFSSANERATRDTLRYFEQVHGFFAQSLGAKSAKAQPVRIIAFGNVKEYEPYKFNEVAIAYYHSTPDGDYVVMSQTGAEVFPLAVHEYVHLVFRNAKMEFPPWLNEGIAELYSTMRSGGNGILVGSLIQGRMSALGREKWVPLQTILTADHSSAYYNEKNKASSLYNEGWALTHMLALSPEYRPKFGAAMEAMAVGGKSIEALEQVYGKPLGKIEQDLQAYLRGSNFNGVTFPFKLEKVVDDLAAEPAPDFELKLALADLTNGPGKPDETRKRYEQLAADQPQRFEPYAALGYLAWRQNRINDARDQFEKAFLLGDRNPRLLWDFGRMAESEKPEESMQSFQELLKLEPDRLDARVELANVQLRQKQSQAALDTLASVKKVTASEASRFFTIMAYAFLDVGNREEARKSGERVVSYAKTPDEKSQGERLLEYLNASDRSRAAAPRASSDSGPPVLERRPGSGQPVPQPTSSEVAANMRPLAMLVNTSSVTGSFLLLDCEGEQAKMTVQAGAEKKFFLIEDPLKILITGRGAATIDMNCGAQEPTRVRVDFAPPSPNQTGIDGLVRRINFLP